MDESQQRETPSGDSAESARENGPRPWLRNVDSVLPAFLPDALTEFRSQLLDTTRYPSSQKEAAQSIERELKSLQDGIVSMPTDDWRSLSEKLQDRLEADREATQNGPSKINDEIYRIGMTHLGKMNEVVAKPQMKSEYLRAVDPEHAARASGAEGIHYETMRQMISRIAGEHGISLEQTSRPELTVTTRPTTIQEYRRSTDTTEETFRYTSAAHQSTEQAGTTAAPQRFTEDDARILAVSARTALASASQYLSEDQRSRLAEIARETETDHASTHSSAEQTSTTASLRFTEDNARDTIATPTNQLASNLRPLSEDQRSDLRAAVERIRNRQNRGLDERSRDTRDYRGR